MISKNLFCWVVVGGGGQENYTNSINQNLFLINKSTVMRTKPVLLENVGSGPRKHCLIINKAVC